MRCEVHEGAEAVGVCAVCGRGCCAECAGPSGFTGQIRCGKCERPAIAPTPASAPHVPPATAPLALGARGGSMMTVGFAGSVVAAVGCFAHFSLFFVLAGTGGGLPIEVVLPGTGAVVAVGVCLVLAATGSLRIALLSRSGRSLVPVGLALACAFPVLLWIGLEIAYYSHSTLLFVMAAYGMAGGAFFFTGGALVMLPRHAPARGTSTAAFVILSVGGTLIASGLVNPSSLGAFLLFGGWVVAGAGLLVASRVFLLAGRSSPRPA